MASAAYGTGFGVSGTANKLKWITVAGDDNKVSKTVALGSGVTDLQDDNANCGGNVWAKSIFGSSEAGGVGSHLCIQ